LFALLLLFYLKLLSDQSLPLNTEQLYCQNQDSHNSSSYFHLSHLSKGSIHFVFKGMSKYGTIHPIAQTRHFKPL